MPVIKKEYHIHTVMTKVKNVATERLEIVGAFIVSEASLRCPVGKYKGGKVGGRLRGSITAATNKEVSRVKPGQGKPPATQADAVSQPIKELTLRVGTSVEYAAPVELGVKTKNRKRRPAKPYLVPAVEENKEQIVRIMNL